ncbi:MAG: DNA polymerase I [Clostridia bacterium]|nr:DNA polymerase I [Clostridia bacterium]
MEKMIVIDGNSILNRAFYGIRDLTNSRGLHTNAVFGMINMLTKYITDVGPDYAAVAFDLKKPTFRHLEYAGYKANRHGMPDELAEQLPYAKAACESMGFRILESEGFEADDILGTVSRISAENGIFTYIVTGDRDSLQLISDSSEVLLATNSDYVRYDAVAFRNRFGIDPGQFVDVKALMGDQSDNIPGVRGIGEKTAFSLISRFGDLDRLYEEYGSSDLTASTKNKLTEGKDIAYLSRKLARIVSDAPLPAEIADMRFGGMDREKMLALCTELEFSAFIKRFGLEEAASDIAAEEPEYRNVFSQELRDLVKGKTVAAVLLPDESMVKVFCEEAGGLIAGSDDPELTDFLFGSGECSVVCYDFKSMYSFLKKVGTDFSSCCFDIMLAAYVLNPGTGDYAFPKVISDALRVSCPDVQSPYLIYEAYGKQKELLEATGQSSLYYEIELPFAKILADMEILGFAVDAGGLLEYSAELEKMEKEYIDAIYMLSGTEFNINSPKQLGEVLFEKLGLPSAKKTKSGYSTSAEVLEKLRPFSPVVDYVLEYRKVAKLRSTYCEGLVKVIGDDGCVHTVFKQTGTATGRISSAEPNLQNIPVRTELGRKLRKYFIPRSPGRVLIDADYSQIELRLLAHISGDRNMIDAFRNGADIHTSTAAEVFRVPEGSVTPEMRKRAKAVNFGIIYGIGAFSLAGDLGISRKQAESYIHGYLATYPGVDAYLKNTVKKAREDGYSVTLFGRRRPIPELASKNRNISGFGERVAMNSPIQGSAADIIKIAMIRTAEALEKEGIDAAVILQVHDEIIIESSEKDSARAAELLRESMEGAAELSVPLETDLHIGRNWLDIK